ncbi:alpha/beta hydrolase [Variovorax sp. PCZ-1]|uniref:alpha/beta fold hydrolase n=1 Tax=Variovorax sp. PCZ-1 TaxID=2835533 RepID=UPI001BCC7955|nr:alpha/beta hydrolase [Variovorax sp. PCZ-1]MBS7808457.1 alpha/beta hydrolase [Variovorax sp. PCZ-1]
MKIKANGISIEVQEYGAKEHPAVLLIMGLGMQLIAWPPTVIEPLVQSGFRVITFDNRDIGLSQHFDHMGKPNIVWASIKRKLGMQIKPPYSLQDMAADTLGVMDALNISQAHIVGVSMGGMIAQRLACAAPERIRSLTCIMSSSGAPGLPEAKAAVMRVLFNRPASNSIEDITAHYVKLFNVIGSPAFPVEPQLLKDRIRLGLERNHHPDGTLRQMLAIGADRTRHLDIARITAPTLVVHGLEDVLVPQENGRDIAQRIKGSRFVGIPGMGHDLAPGAVAEWLPEFLKHIQHEHA